MNCSRVQKRQGQGRSAREEAATKGWDKVADPLCKNPLCTWLSSLCPSQGPQAAGRVPMGLLKTVLQHSVTSSPSSWACGPSPPQG